MPRLVWHGVACRVDGVRVGVRVRARVVFRFSTSGWDEILFSNCRPTLPKTHHSPTVPCRHGSCGGGSRVSLSVVTAQTVVPPLTRRWCFTMPNVCLWGDTQIYSNTALYCLRGTFTGTIHPHPRAQLGYCTCTHMHLPRFCDAMSVLLCGGKGVAELWLQNTFHSVEITE